VHRWYLQPSASFFLSFPVHSLLRTIFELKEFIDAKTREADYSILKVNCLRVSSRTYDPRFTASTTARHRCF